MLKGRKRWDGTFGPQRIGRGRQVREGVFISHATSSLWLLCAQYTMPLSNKKRRPLFRMTCHRHTKERQHYARVSIRFIRRTRMTYWTIIFKLRYIGVAIKAPTT